MNILLPDTQARDVMRAPLADLSLDALGPDGAAGAHAAYTKTLLMAEAA